VVREITQGGGPVVMLTCRGMSGVKCSGRNNPGRSSGNVNV